MEKNEEPQKINPIEQLGKIAGYTGLPLTQAISEEIKKNPEKLEQFLTGYTQGQIKANDKPIEK